MSDKDHISENKPRISGGCLPAYVMMALSGLLGGISLVLFSAFLFAGLPSQIHFGLNEISSLSINTLLCFLFFLQHSLMLRSGFRKWVSEYLPSNYHGALFSIFSGWFLFLIMLFWQKSTLNRVEFEGALFWVMRCLFLLSIFGLYFSSRSLRRFDPFGIRDISMQLKGKPRKGSAFIVRGMYQWVRHPLYFFILLMIWTPVSVSTDRLLFNGLWTTWIIVGTILEERDLVASFGDEYRNYRRNVPMLIPYKGVPWRMIS